ncbi:MAG: hypothetical protein M0Z53_01290 [Thermaerobacter sp.]|nr:hypothetical protein [Thermaerobacter sp.]
MRIGYLTHQDIRAWFNEPQWDRAALIPLPSINNALVTITAQAIDMLAIDPTWFDDIRWLAALVEVAEWHHIHVVMLFRHLKTSLRHLQPGAGPEAPPVPHTSPCVTVDTQSNILRHHGQPLALPPKAVTLLQILAENPAPIRLDAINAMGITEHGRTPWTQGTFKAYIHILRKTLGTSHVITVPHRGYRFSGC